MPKQLKLQDIMDNRRGFIDGWGWDRLQQTIWGVLSDTWTYRPGWLDLELRITQQLDHPHPISIHLYQEDGLLGHTTVETLDQAPPAARKLYIDLVQKLAEPIGGVVISTETPRPVDVPTVVEYLHHAIGAILNRREEEKRAHVIAGNLDMVDSLHLAGAVAVTLIQDLQSELRAPTPDTLRRVEWIGHTARLLRPRIG